MEAVLTVAGRVLYLSQWFWPEPAIRGLRIAQDLQRRGHEVEVLTGFPNYPSGRLTEGYRLAPYRREQHEGVTIHRVFLYPSHDRSSLKRALNYLSFFVSALIFCLIQLRRFDLVYVYHPPITSGLAAALASAIWRKPFVLEVQDLWPDSVAASGMASTGALARMLGPICRFVYRRAALVLGQSEGMAARLVEYGASPDRVDVLFNWADEDAARANGLYDVASLGFDGRFNFVYAGNLGAVQALEVLIDAIDRIKDQAPNVLLTLIGQGTERERLEALVAERASGHVQIRPGVPPTHIGDVLAAADVLVVHLKRDPLFAITIPSKTQFNMAMGKPILIGVNGEAARIVTEAGAGLAVEPEDVDEMAQAMLTMIRTPRAELDAMGARGRRAYEARFAFDATMARVAGHVGRLSGTKVPLRTAA